MNTFVAGVVRALVFVGLAALGGAAVVYSEYDDAPGGVLIGFLLVIVAALLAVRDARRGG